MDLDFSFALVSSLTPRSQTIRSPLATNKLTSKSLKTKQRQSVSSESRTSKLSHQENKDNKENQSPKGQLMKKNENYKADMVHETKCIETEICSDSNATCSFPVSLVNISIRKNRFRSKKKSSCDHFLIKENTLNGVKEGILNEKSSPTRRRDLVSTTLNSKDKHFDNLCHKVTGDSPTGCNDSLGSCHIITKGVKRKSLRLAGLNKASLSANSSLDFVESPCSEVKNIVSKTDNIFCKDTNLTDGIKQNFPKVSDLSEISISPAYDSDSFIKTRRRSVKVIPETPETDQSLQNDIHDKEKCSIESDASKTCKDKSNSRNSNCENEKNKSVTYSRSFSENTLPHDNKLGTCFSNSELDVEPKKKLRSSNEDSSLTDMFRFESSIKSHSNSPTIKKIEVNGAKEKTDVNRAKKDKRKLSMSPVLKEINKTNVDCTKSNSVKEKKLKKKETLHQKLKGDVEGENICKTVVNGKKSEQRTSNKYLINSPVNISSTKSSLVLPLEVIPKFEHINNWLKETQANSIISLSSESSLDSPIKGIKLKRQKSKNRLTISPRIKSKMKIAQSTLQEEQRVFEEVHGSDMAKRLSEDTEDVLSVASSRDSVELSEKVLEKLYGTVWQKSVVAPHTEPRKTRKKKGSSKKKTPLIEKKKQRTSIYDVFSSSSSEDRFEEFLESVRRGKFESTRRHSSRPGTPDFIDDDSGSDSNCSLVFYHNLVSSAVKEEVSQLRHKDGDNVSTKDNRRRLSFASSKDDCSESGKSDGKPKGKKPPTTEQKKDNRKPRTKKINKDSEEKTSSDIIGFTLVTPIKVKNKTEDELQNRIKSVIKPEVPRSVGKSKTPKNPTKRDDNLDSKVKLSTKHLVEGDFKVPKHLSSLKTPTNPTRRDVPSSPALSFLSSLSEVTAGLPSHPDALVFKKNFKTKREELTKKLFCLYNKEVFENELPADMSVQWSTRMTSTSGYCYNKRTYSNNQIFRSSRIVLSTKILDRADRLRDTLIHELCHAATWIVNATSDGHGPKWRAWADKANRRFPELPVIKRCHDYAISTKFTYKCMSCGYCIGRHSKSLDTERKRCGYCYGRFQVFVTAKMSATSAATSDSDSVKTPHNPTGFALFVKDNYATVKKENNVPHGQVMKLLSQKFAEVKISKQSGKEPT